jgi:hypothetical protein
MLVKMEKTITGRFKLGCFARNTLTNQIPTNNQMAETAAWLELYDSPVLGFGG